MTEAPGPHRMLAWARRHERGIVFLVLTVGGLGLAAFGWSRTRGWGLEALEQAIDSRNDRWSPRLREAERMLAEGRLLIAERQLVRLDESHPARIARHGLDKQRERILLRLAETYEAQGRRGRALATYGRLVAFDSLNHLNHFALGSALQRMSRTWSIPPEARDAFAASLELNPNHLPSLRGYAGYYFERGEFEEVIAAFRRYHDAVLVQTVTLSAPGWTASGQVLVSAEPQTLKIPLESSSEGDLTLRIDPGGLPASIDSVVFLPAAIVGSRGARPSVSLERISDTGFSLSSIGDTAGAVRVHLRLFKPMDPVLWGRIAQSYRNLLDDAGLIRMTEQTHVMRSSEQADLTLARLPWARGERLVGPDEGPF